GLFVDQGCNVLAVNLNCVELFSRVILSSCSCFDDLVGESAEIRVLCNEVGFTVDFNHGVTGNSYKTFGSFTVSTLGDDLCALDAHNLNSLDVVGASFFDGLLPAMHAGIESLAQC